MENNMKKYLIAAAILATSVVGAEAKCSTKSLNGSWTLFAASDSALIMTIQNGNTTIEGSATTMTLGKNCKGTMNITGVPVPFKLTAERISPTSDLKPNTLVAVAESGGNFLVFELARR
jgi:hypothetical protein